MMKTIDYYMGLPYRMEIVPDTEEGGFTVWFPDLPGCLTCAESLTEAVSNAVDAKRAWLLSAIDEGIAIAEPSKDTIISGYINQNIIQMHNHSKDSTAVMAEPVVAYSAE